MALFLAAFLFVHGLIHLLGTAKAWHLAQLPQLSQPISPLSGGLWLAASLLFCAAVPLRDSLDPDTRGVSGWP